MVVTQLLPWAACSVLDNPFGDDTFPNIQPKLPLAQPEDVSSPPVTGYLGEGTEPRLSTACFPAVVGSHRVPPEPPAFQ